MPDYPYDLGSKKHVFIDWDLIEPGYGVGWAGDTPRSWEMPYGVTLAVHHPRIDGAPMVQADRPWESTLNVYSTLFEDEGRFRLYYECYFKGKGHEQSDYGAMMAYAESSDGVRWVKPNVGAVRFNGSTDNNLVYGLDVSLGRGAHGATVFKDPGASSEQRYKLVHMGRQNGAPAVFGAVSPDGLRWTALESPVVPGYFSDTQTVVSFDEAKGRYVGYFRGWTAHESGKAHGRRTIAYAETDRFDEWPQPRQIVAPDMHDGPDTDIYTNGYTRWPGADAHLMFPAFYRRALDICEVHMLTSRDGLHWERPIRQPIVPRGEPGSDSEGSVYAGCGLAAFTPGELSLPIGPVWHTHNQGHYPQLEPAAPPHRGYVGVATWRRDGFTSLETDAEGACATVPFTFSGGALELNAWTRFGGEISIELVDASAVTMSSAGRTAPGRSFGDCDPITGDNLKRTVTWRGESDVSAWAGKPVRLRMRMRRARLYAIQFA